MDRDTLLTNWQALRQQFSIAGETVSELRQKSEAAFASTLTPQAAREDVVF